MSFCTVINCMDGRTQLPAINFLTRRFAADYVDSITEPGPVDILAEQKNESLLKSIFDRLDISVNQHGSKSVAIVAHHDCTGNPEDKERQIGQLALAVGFVQSKYETCEVIGLWIDENWKVTEV